LTPLGRTCRDGWTCERCDTWHDATDRHYSDANCNKTGKGVQLCEGCVRVHELSRTTCEYESALATNGCGSHCRHCGETTE